MTTPPQSPYIVGRLYDWLFFLLPPLLSLGVGIAISATALGSHKFLLASRELTAAKLFIGVLIHAHLVAVLFRSHGNPAIFRRHRLRFLLLPLLLFALIRSTAWLAVTATVVVTWWDVWHSGAQTFGFGRIYDRNQGNRPELGRRLDYWLNQLLYAGPILGGVTLLDHLSALNGFEDLGTSLFRVVPAAAPGWRQHLAIALLTVGVVYLGYYSYSYVQLYRQGYRVSLHKLFLFVTTGACSIYSWGLNSWGEAFFIMNLFHAVQYLALVYATEHQQLGQRLGRLGSKRWLVGAIYLGSVFSYGLAAVLIEVDLPTLWTVTIVVSLLHFFYDGFIWSVAKQQI